LSQHLQGVLQPMLVTAKAQCGWAAACQPAGYTRGAAVRVQQHGLQGVGRVR
jgi:hypothetical protein